MREQLRETVERMHNGTATLAQSVPVRETFEGKTVWEGVVHVFDLTGHPTGDPRLCLVLSDRGEQPVDSPQTAVRAAIVAEHRFAR
jgi:hypothetical protein